MKLYWKDAAGNLLEMNGDFDTARVVVVPAEKGEQTLRYELPDGLGDFLEVKGSPDDHPALVAQLKRLYECELSRRFRSPFTGNGESERVTIAREMFEMLKGHTESQSPRCIPVRAGEAVPPLRMSAHEVHELADGAARLIAATGGAPILRPVGATLKREAQ